MIHPVHFFFFLLAFMLLVNECISEKEKMRYKFVHSVRLAEVHCIAGMSTMLVLVV